MSVLAKENKGLKEEIGEMVFSNGNAKKSNAGKVGLPSKVQKKKWEWRSGELIEKRFGLKTYFHNNKKIISIILNLFDGIKIKLRTLQVINGVKSSRFSRLMEINLDRAHSNWKHYQVTEKFQNKFCRSKFSSPRYFTLPSGVSWCWWTFRLSYLMEKS